MILLIVMDPINGVMENIITGNGNRGKCRVWDNCIFLMGFCTKDNSKMIKDMEKVKQSLIFLKFIEAHGLSI